MRVSITECLVAYVSSASGRLGRHTADGKYGERKEAQHNGHKKKLDI